MKNKFYITTAIVYTNGPVHIGYAMELIQADVLARYHRQIGDQTWFLTGTDEHGTTVSRAAQKNNTEPQSFVDSIAEQAQDLTRKLNISNDDFIRTSDQKRHWPTPVKIWNQLKESGDLYKGTYKGLYCVGHESFIKKTDLVDGVCPLHKTVPEEIEEENYFFKLSEYKDTIIKKIKNDELKIVPASKKPEILNVVKDAEDISVSRPSSVLTWGIPVPGDDSQRLWVWLDALPNYISALGYATGDEKFKKYWPADIHLIGKDILRFHALIWPAILLSLGIELPKSIFVHGFITVDGQKMSKTIGNVVDPFAMIEKYGADVVRYFLLREIPSDEDGDFSEERLRERYISDLANGLGNLVQRVATLIDTKMDGEIIYHEKLLPDVEELNEVENDTEINKYIENFKLHEALALIWKKIDVANAFVNEEAPWKLVDENPEQFQKVMLALVEMVHHIAWNLQPFMPETAAKIREVFGDTNNKVISNDFHFVIKKGAVLFPRLS